MKTIGLEAAVKDTGSIDYIETEMGSQYRYLPDGRSQRVRAGDSRPHSPKDILVFIPNYEWLQANTSVIAEHFEDIGEYQRTLASQAHIPGRGFRVLDNKGRRLESNAEVASAEYTQLALVEEIVEGHELSSGKIKICIPVSNKPVIGFYAFDSAKVPFKDRHTLANHVGNRVTKIQLKDGTVIQ